MRRAAVVGASGYVGGELLRLLVGHPELEPVQVTSERLGGRYVHSAHPNLRGATELRFSSRDDLEPVDVLFLCLPHGEASREIGRFTPLADLVVDCSADFRLRDASHSFVYGLPEMERERLRGASRVSGVGCNATAVNLALWPLARAGLVERVVADVKVGSSEAGAKSTAASHHPERAGAVRSFAPVGHRHQAEILQQLGLEAEQLYFSATAIDMVRGVAATCHVFPRRELTDRELWTLYREAYAGEPFVRLVRDRGGLYRYPEPKVVTGTNFCDVGWEVEEGGRRIVVLAALDNLMKGAAGSALQSANVAFGIPETAGLELIGLHPI